MPSPLERVIADLRRLDTQALRARWRDVVGEPAPRQMSRDLLLRALACEVQVRAEGGLNKTALRRIVVLGTAKEEGSANKRPWFRPRPGMRLVREWRGEVHQVTVCDDGFDYRGTRYASLSQIARAITGTRWSGPLFFGLRKPAPRLAAPADSG
ncbi:MAG: DUF2924 domain-containing protein [Vicinamibacterales bacterium]